MLTLAREGAVVGEPEPVALADLCREGWESVPSDTATLSVETDRTIHADRSRLQQLLENLFRNAVEHGGPEVAVTVGALDDGFYVADDGPGIPPDVRDRVLAGGYTTSDAGAGLGLAIVARIADGHGWETSITEHDAGGARIEFRGVETSEA